MGLAAKKETQKYTYEDYLSWDDGKHLEIIDGDLYDMSPAPGRYHQEISLELLLQLGQQLKDSPCKVYHPPFDVRLPLTEQEDDIKNVVQPDISVVCDSKKLDEKGCIGAPDLIIEILSPTTSRYDRMVKFNLYETAGVREYWLVSPAEKMVEVFLLGNDGRYGRPSMYSDVDTIPVPGLKGVEIDLKAVFGS